MADSDPGDEMTDDPFDVEMLAASLRADTADLGLFLEVMAGKFEGALPSRTRVERSGGRFGRRATVQRVGISLGDRAWTLSRGRGGVLAEVTHEVRGVRLSGEQVDLETWTATLAGALATFAQSESRGREALGRLLE